MARKGIDDYLEEKRKRLREVGEFITKGPRLGPQATSAPKPRPRDNRGGDSGVRINPKNVQVTRTGLERRKRTADQRSTRGYGGRRGY